MGEGQRSFAERVEPELNLKGSTGAGERGTLPPNLLAYDARHAECAEMGPALWEATEALGSRWPGLVPDHVSGAGCTVLCTPCSG